jgi:hypothetical protein
VVHQAASRYDRLPCGISGCRSVSIGYFKSRCSASGYKVERDEQVKSIKNCKVERDEQIRSIKKKCRSALGAKD